MEQSGIDWERVRPTVPTEPEPTPKPALRRTAMHRHPYVGPAVTVPVPMSATPAIGAIETVPLPGERWLPKMLVERLCQQQTFAPDAFTRMEIQRLIDVLHLHRPVGPDGKHNALHTPTCGCEASL